MRAPSDVSPRWHKSAPLLLPCSGEIVAADIAVAASGTLRLVITDQSQPAAVTVLEIRGNPTVLKPDGVALSSHVVVCS